MSEFAKIRIYFFSGTGNAKRVSFWISEFVKSQSVECLIFDISKPEKLDYDFDEQELICFISPTHGFNYPKIALDFLRKFPKGKNRFLLMNTRAGMRLGKWVTPGLTGIGFILATLMLRGKGYKIIGTIPFDMPSNWISLHPALTKYAINFLHEKINEKVKIRFARILNGKNDFKAYREIVQDLLISPISLGYYLVGRFLIAKTFYASSSCDNCGLCVSSCPVEAIQVKNGRPYWKFTCESCMKCMNSCPKKAIETGHVFIIGVSVISSAASTYLMNIFLSDFIGNTAIEWAVLTPLLFLITWLTYRGQQFLLRYKLFNRVVTMLSITHYKFWGRYKSVADKVWMGDVKE